jgi:hypothetical protein
MSFQEACLPFAIFSRKFAFRMRPESYPKESSILYKGGILSAQWLKVN